jgi:molybdopterin/thiamine biosynthesis adenylyltransferase
VADGLCRLLKGSDIKIILNDYDIVEEPNLFRQNFYASDLGKFKAQVLAERLARQYGREIGYIVFPFEKDIFDTDYGGDFRSRSIHMLIIGCTDKTESRRNIAESITGMNCWLDSGNGFNSGQVLIGNANKKEHLRECFNEGAHTVSRLPSPSMQVPALLIPPTKPEPARDCAEAVVDNEQSPTINIAMATLVLDFVWKFLSNKLTTMGAYIDLDAGSLKYVPADPKIMARMFSIKEESLMANQCSIGMRYHV